MVHTTIGTVSQLHMQVTTLKWYKQVP